MKRNGTRRLLAGLLALVMVLVLLPTVSAQADSEIEIANYEQLKAFAARVNGGEHGLSAKLTEDITCTDKTWTPIGTDNESYKGTFNGQGHTITGLSNADVDYSGLSADDEVYIGLFGVVESGKVQNVVIEDCELSFASDVDVCVFMGAVVGRNESGTVEDCSVSGTVSGSKNGPNRLYVGGVVGQNRHFVRNCRNTGAVSASGKDYSVYVGGVVGGSDGSEQYCVNTGAINGGGNAVAGGVTGSGESVKNCMNAGAVNGYALGGGIVGYTAYGTVENCLNVGAVSDGAYSGGIVGQNAYGAVKTCLSVGAVSGTEFVGGVVGHCPYAASPNFCVENCYCLYTETSDAIGYEGAATVTNVSAHSADDLKSLSNCVGFSEDIWAEGPAFPLLSAFDYLIYDANGGTGDMPYTVAIDGYALTAAENAFTNTDSEFTGWNTQADGEGDPIEAKSEVTLGSGEVFRTLYAQWRSTVVEIASYEQLKAFAARVNGGEYGLNAKITSDFTCPTATDWTPICPESEHGYTGTFNGNNCVITGLKFNQTITSDATQLQRWYIGLFGVIETGGTVQDLYLKDCSIQVSVSAPYFNLYEGAVAGRNFGTITACGVFGEGEISGVRTGGDKSANAFIGGIAGYNNGIITDSCFIGTVNVQSNASSNGFSPAEIGGIAGRNPSGGNRTAIENCFHSGSVIASGGDFVQTSVGGIVGTNYAGLRNCRHNGSVQGVESKSYLYNSIGGVAGTNGVQGIITYCYARSAVEELEGGSGLLYLGGVVGANNGGSTSDCFCDTTLAPDTEAIGYVGSGSFSDVVGLASEAFADESNFSGWENFDMNWVMGVDQPEVKALSAPVRLYANSNEDVVILNNIPVCTPVKFANPFTYEGHEFTGWNTQADGDGVPYSEDDEITLLPGETLSLSAQWKTNAFMIMFQNEDGTELQSGEVLLGETPTYTGEEPTKPATAQYTYTFAGWKDENGIVYGLTDDLPAVTGEMTYTAIYTSTVNEYTITFVNEDGTVLQEELIAYGETPEYNGETPTKAHTDHYEYTFASWDPEIVPVTGDATYTAVFTESLLHPIFICGDVDAMDSVVKEGDETLYRYDVTVTDLLDSAVEVNSAQIFLTYDHDKLELKRGEGAVDWTINDADELLSAAWASDSTTTLKNGDVVLTLYFAAKNVAPGETVAIGFAQNNLGLGSALSFVEEGETTEFFAKTQDGSITFAMPDAVTIAGADVLSGDIYAIENGKILYRYDLRMKDLPEAGLWINSAQIFVEFDHAILALARTEGAFDWTVTENGDKLMAVWASDEDVQINEDDVVLTLWFEKIGEAPEDGRVPIVFTTNLLGNTSAVSIAFFGTVTELETNTVDGSITFEEIVYGDANCDGVVTSADAALILRAIVGLSELSMRGALNADVDGDMEVTAADAALILRYVVGLVGSLPA